MLIPWLLGPCLLAQHPSSLGWENRSRSGSCSLSLGICPLYRLPQSSPPRQGEMDPFFAQCLLAGAFVPRGLYIHIVHPTPSMLHACYILQPKCSPSVASTLPPCARVVG